jgi:hypothetical protein
MRTNTMAQFCPGGPHTKVTSRLLFCYLTAAIFQTGKMQRHVRHRNQL